MGKNPVAAIVAVIILIVAVVMIAKSMSGGSAVQGGDTDAFWYDTGSKELYGGPHDIPPLKAPSGSDGVRAYVFASTSCDKAGDRFISHLETNPDREAHLNARSIEERVALAGAQMIRREADADWVTADSDEGRAILQETFEAGQNNVPCLKYTK